MSANIPLMPRGSHFLLLRQKQVTKEKATPTIGLFLRCSEKSGTKKTRYAQTVFRSDRFFPPLLGANQRGPVEPIFDRFAMCAAAADASVRGAHVLRPIHVYEHETIRI